MGSFIKKCENIRSKFIPGIGLACVLLLLAYSCVTERERYYEEPTWGGQSLYNTLQGEQRFGQYLKCVERTEYRTALKGNGLWTVFAPNDEAVNAYLAKKGYASVEDIPQDEVDRLVAYSLLYNKYEFMRLSDVLSGKWDTLKSIKKRTPYYETLHRELYKGDSIWVANPTTYSAWSPSDNNYKYLPFYLDRNFIASKTADDYAKFYKTAYTGHNVQSASVVKQDMKASNGVAHEVDAVSEPLPTLEELLNGDAYSEYKKLLEEKNGTGEPFFYSYLTAPAMLTYYQTMYPNRNIDKVYCKFYNVPFEFLRTSSDALAIPLNVERYFLAGAEEGGYTLFAPNNVAVEKFYNEVVKDYGYESVAALPSNVLSYFVNAQMCLNMVWPSEYKGARNVYENFVNGAGKGGEDFSEAKFVDLQPASNGLFYGSNDYVKCHYFESVFTEILMRPDKYTFFYNALNKHFATTLMEDFVRCPLNGYTEQNYTVLLPTTEQFEADGFTWVWPQGSNAYEFRHANTVVNASERIQRLVRSCVFKRKRTAAYDYSLTSFAGDESNANGYDGYEYAVNDYGDMVRYKNDELEYIGNYLAGEKVKVTKVKTFSNGQVFTVDKLPQYSQLDGTTAENVPTLAECLEKAKQDNPNISIAADLLIYLITSRTVGSTTYAAKMTINPASFGTLLLPTNEKMKELQARKERMPLDEDGTSWEDRFIYCDLSVLKRQEESGENASSLVNWSQSVADYMNLFRYHLLPGYLLLNDGLPEILFSNGTVQPDAIAVTSYKDGLSSTFVRVSKDYAEGNNLQFTTHELPNIGTRTASVVKGVTHSNLFAPQIVIHEVDNYLFYR